MKKSIVSAVVTLCLLTGGLILYFQNRRDVPVSESGGPSAVSRKQGPFSFIPRGWVEKSSYVDYRNLPRQTLADDFDSYLRAAWEEEHASLRAQKVGVMAAVASYTDMEKAFELLEPLSPKQRRSAIRTMLDYVSGDEHLASLLSKFEENGDREDLLTVGSWASSLFTAQKVGRDRLLELASMVRRQELVEGLARNAGSASASKTPEELPQLPEAVIGPFLAGYAEERSEISPEDVVRAVNQYPSHALTTLDGALTRIIRKHGIPAGLELVNALEGEAKAQGYWHMAIHWTRFNSIESSQWVDSLPPGKPKDQAILGMLLAIPQDSRRQAAEAWVDRVQDPSIKEEIISHHLSDSE